LSTPWRKNIPLTSDPKNPWKKLKNDPAVVILSGRLSSAFQYFFIAFGGRLDTPGAFAYTFRVVGAIFNPCHDNRRLLL